MLMRNAANRPQSPSFSQMLSGMSEAEREELHLRADATAYHYLNQSGCTLLSRLAPPASLGAPVPARARDHRVFTASAARDACAPRRR
jgi:hypothetical protein